MTTLVDLRSGDQVIFGARVTAASQANGLTMELYGPNRQKAADCQMHPDGTLTGNLADQPQNIEVQRASGFSPISVGDVMEHNENGMTAVCRWTQINDNGAILWSPSVDHKVIYRARDFQVIGHVDLS